MPKPAPNTKSVPGGLYKLKYLTGNLTDFKILQFDKEYLELSDVVKLAKKYCAAHSIRFVFIEAAVTIVAVDDLADIVE